MESPEGSGPFLTSWTQISDEATSLPFIVLMFSLMYCSSSPGFPRSNSSCVSCQDSMPDVSESLLPGIAVMRMCRSARIPRHSRGKQGDTAWH
jgi:hypothetical protein